MRQQMKELEYIGHGLVTESTQGAIVQPPEGDPRDLHLSFIGLIEATDDVEQRGLPAPALADQGEQLSRLDLKIQTAKHGRDDLGV